MYPTKMVKIEDDKEIIQYIKYVRIPIKEVPLLFRIHKGFDSIEEVKVYLGAKSIDYSNVAIIRFLKMYYVVAFEDYNKEFMIGKNNYFYTNDKYMLIQGKTPNFKPKFYPSFLKEQVYKHWELYYDLESIDDEIDVMINDVSIKKYDYAKTYIILLGLSFFSAYIQRDELTILGYYFSDNYSYIFRENPNVIGINPFKAKIMYSDGKKVNYQFFRRKEQRISSPYRKFANYW